MHAADNNPLAPPLSDGQWHHVAVSLAAGSTNCFALVDGIKSTFTCNSDTILKTGTIVLGQDQDSVVGVFDENQAFYGRLSRVFVYGEALGEGVLRDIGNHHQVATPIATFADFASLGGVVTEPTSLAVEPGKIPKDLVAVLARRGAMRKDFRKDLGRGVRARESPR